MDFVYQPKPHPMLMRVWGIPIRIHRWLLILMGIIAVMAGSQTGGFSGQAMLGTAIALGILFSAVLLHEMGHAWAAQRHGIEVVDITLWPLGGMAVMRNMPEDPQVEMRVAAAGPLVNVAIGGICLLAWVGWQGSLDWQALRSTQVTGGSAFLSFTALCHLMLGLFNLLPAFPMDGGKILRSALVGPRTWLQATEVAVRIGRWLAWGMIVAAFVYGEWALAIIGVYLLLSGTKELWSTRVRHPMDSQGPIGRWFEAMQEQARQAQGHPGQAPDPESSQGFSGNEATGDGLANAKGSPGFSDEDIRELERRKDRIR